MPLVVSVWEIDHGPPVTVTVAPETAAASWVTLTTRVPVGGVASTSATFVVEPTVTEADALGDVCVFVAETV